MKLNIFRIPKETVGSLKTKLINVGMTVVHVATYGEWQTEFYFSREPEPVAIPWVEDFAPELASLESTPTNSLHFGAFVWQSEEYCFTLSFGKTHFYLREFCDGEFGLDMARRIGQKDDVRQKAARRYAGRRKKEIRSYQRETQLDIESGESIDYLQAATMDAEQWGPTAKFGSSLGIHPTVEHDGLAEFMTYVGETLNNEPLFQLPRIETVKDDAEIARYDSELIKAIMDETAEFGEDGPQLIGVDFVFAGQEQYSFHYKRAASPPFDMLSVRELRNFIHENSIQEDQLFKIKLRVMREDSKEYSLELKKALEYSVEKVFLQRGKWVRFNEDYAESLDSFIDEAIEFDNTIEPDLRETSLAEPAFNEALRDRGYEYADRNLSIIELRGYRVEAWDLKKDKTAYAVKFGTAKDLGYVCDQAINVLEIYRNEPATFNNIELDTYCLWLVLERVTPISKLSEIKSIILKQKLDAWVHKCRELGVKPTFRISMRVKH